MSETTSILLLDGGEVTFVTGEDSSRVFRRFEAVEREARRWQSMTRQPNEVVVIDRALIATVKAFLANEHAI